MNRKLTATMFTAFCLAAGYSSAADTPNAIETKTEPFALEDVTLLDSPFLKLQEIDKDYLMNVLKPDPLIAGIRERAGLPKKANKYGGWESQGINGHGLGHYLSALAACYAQTRDEKVKDRLNYILDELELCQQKNGNGYLHSVDQNVYEKVKSGNFTVGGFDINNWWVPNYSLHKIFAGLRDAYRYAGCKKALEIEKKLGDWYDGIVSPLNEEQRQKLLGSEWGGMNETFCQLAQDTGNMHYLEIAEKYFDHKRIFDPLKQGQDRLTGLHANTQVPKIVGLATEYEMTGKKEYRTAVETFWNSVVRERSFANGGHSDSEHFFDVSQFPQKLGHKNCETCNINNMIRLTGHLFQWEPTAEQMDFVERALINQILANIGQKQGEFGYFISQKPVSMKVFSTPENAWWCCVGTGMENPMHYAEQAYFHKNNNLWINLYIGSQLNWKDQGITLKQITQFPNADTIRFEITAKQPVKLAFNFRHPYWCELPQMKINGEAQTITSKPSSYFTIERTWKTGDVIDLTLPMQLHIQPLPHSDNKFIAFMYGPMVLTGIVPPEEGKEDMAKRRWDDHLKAPYATNETAANIVSNDPLNAWKKLELKSKSPLEFVSKGLAKPGEITLRPFHTVYEEHYTMYFPVMSEENWQVEQKRLEEIAAEQKRLEALRTDLVTPGFQQTEVNHGYQGNRSEAGDFQNRKYRHAQGADGWFSYKMAVDPQKPVKLVVTYCSGDNGREFDILIDGQKLASEKLQAPRGRGGMRGNQSSFYDKTYELPEAMTKGKSSVTVRFQGSANTSYVGGVFNIVITR